MGSILSPELAAAVSNAGALGQLTFAGIPIDEAQKRLDLLSSLTTKPFGVNQLIPYLDRDILAMSARKAKVIDFFWGDPDPELVRVVHEAGGLASWQVGSVVEAIAAEKAGCDFIIAQGVEAGGHIRGTLGLMPLLTQVLDKVSIPVLGAGGIGSGRGIAALLAAGASGARMGTRFIAAAESNAHPDYVRAIISAQAEDSIRTNRFEVECPLCPSTHGVLRSPRRSMARSLPSSMASPSPSSAVPRRSKASRATSGRWRATPGSPWVRCVACSPPPRS